MTILYVLILISSISFLGYGVAYFTTSKMKQEFERFGLAKLGSLTAILEIMGAVGLFVGMRNEIILLISSGGLALLMLLGVGVRVKVGDTLWVTIPALFYMIINAYIFFLSYLSL